MKKLLGILVLIISVPLLLVGISQILISGNTGIDLFTTILIGVLPTYGGIKLIKSQKKRNIINKLRKNNSTNFLKFYRNNFSSTNDEFATFTISTGCNLEKSNNKTFGRWINNNETMTIKNTTINKGFFYYGGVLKSLDGYSSESSLVDDKLKIQNSEMTYSDNSLGYWPQFISISPKCRGAYINWLASDRSDKNTPIGYVFIYFYGIERRVLIDGQNNLVDDSEYISLFDEINRLRKIFQENRSFYNYSTRLMEYMCLSRQKVVSILEDEEDYLTSNDSLLFKHKLATTVANGMPIMSELAMQWLKNYPEYCLKTPARRCEKEFAELFKYRFSEKYKNNFIVKPNKTKLKMSYYPASSSIQGINIEQQDLPDPSMLKGPTKKLIDIAEKCIQKLDAYSRYLGKKNTKRNDVEALLLLPDQIESKESLNLISSIQKICSDIIKNNNGIITFKNFWNTTDIFLPKKINKKENEILIKLAQKANFGIAPDYRFHIAKPSVEGNIVIFEEGHGDFFDPSTTFNEIGMILRLGVMVARSDSTVDISEIDILKQQIDFNTNLSPVEKKSLHAYLTWKLNSPIDMFGLKKSLGKISQEGKKFISKILINIAIADGSIDPAEITQLEKLYTALDIDKNLVTSDIHNFASEMSNIHKIQSSKMKPIKEKDDKFKLDKDILALHETETKDVQNILSAIFVDEKTEILAEKTVDKVPAELNNGLDLKHNSLYDTLITKEKWNRKEIEKICQKLGIMVDGAIEVINDWSFEKVDSPLIEDDEYIYIDKEIVEELVG